MRRASIAPDTRAASLPCLKRISVGIERMAKRPATPGAASVSTFAKRARVFISAAARSKPGAIAWQGPHQSAQKSTTTGSSVRSTAAWKVASVTGTGLPSSRGALHLPQTGPSASRSGGTRFRVAHFGQPISTLVDPRAGDLHHARHLGEVGAQQLGEGVRAERLRHHALLVQALEYHRVLQQLAHGGVDRVDRAARDARRAEDPDPGIEAVARHAALVDGGEVG